MFGFEGGLEEAGGDPRYEEVRPKFLIETRGFFFHLVEIISGS